MASLRHTLAAINEMKAAGVISDYAVAGAMALAALMDLPGLNRPLVDDILRRHGLSF